MVFSVAFSHKPADCPAAHKDQMEGFTRLVSPDNLKGRGIRLVEGYVDKLWLAPSEKGHFSYFVFEADSEQKIRDLFKPGPVDLRTLERWSDMTKAAK